MSSPTALLLPLALLVAACATGPTRGSATAEDPTGPTAISPSGATVVPDLPVSQPPFERVEASWKDRMEVPYAYMEHRGSYAETGALIPGLLRELEAQGLEPIESEIRRVGQFIEAANRTIDVTIDLPRGTRALPNMVATVHITDLALDSALALPSAVVQQDANGQEYVYIIKGDQATKQTVQTGVMSDGLLLIESGLKAGDRVINRGAARVVDGERVTLIES